VKGRCLDIIGPGEGDELGAARRDRHELDDDVDLVRGDVRDARRRVLLDELDGVLVVEEALARMWAMAMSMPTSSPASFSKCQGALVLRCRR
jgi:porphobilinogen deaminase